ncbi:tRNA pseudouridine(38-40) synthase TruA [Candidatus Protochlamydia phocaeensis]|uniref:tRNA pseudouridine(38-40) synthase TruA n=1 Tax=Candidatus Protochlamydia phocaeensis TaxID=1414722 RepID=UPI000837E15D|nr:tRNA pseudouridine(38-40) synthase TruA [Candidatus Protochlamydia phocaeensis]
MHTYKLTIAYDGTHYSGWQIQPNAPSIQQHLQETLCTLLREEKVVVTGSGRTDAGVHAIAQIAHFKSEKRLDLNRLQFALNGMLPHDIRIKQAEMAALHFHAQYSAIGKEYHYFLHLDRVMDPFRRLYCWHVHSKIDSDLLKEAAARFVGTHDFTSFANEAHTGTAAHDPVRTLYRLDIKPVEGGLRMEFEGNGFLYKMVRNIVGTLEEVASHKRPLEDIEAIFAAKDRRKAGKAAPPQGLFLARVDYPGDHLMKLSGSEPQGVL